MPRLTYPLIRYRFDDGSQEEHALHPYIPIRISNLPSGRGAKVYALVDTGADECLFGADIAEQLGHDLKGDGVKSSVNIGIEQREISVYKHTFNLELLSPDEKTVVWASGKIEIDCSESNPPILLGARDFLRYFKWVVDYPGEKLIINW